MTLSLHSLSDNDILSRTRALTAQERQATLLLLAHLNEIERRRLHLKQGYQSMFDYCTSGLAYSASAAMRRIRTARCIARFPEVYELLESNGVNLSTISQVSRVLTVENRAEVLRRIRGKSQRDVEAIAAEYEPRAALPPDRVRTVVMHASLMADPGRTRTMNDHADASSGGVGATGTASAPSGMLLSVTNLQGRHNRSGCNGGESPCAHNGNGCAPDAPTVHGGTATIKRAVIQFSASEAFMAKLERVRSLAWHRLPANPSLEQAFELALDCFIEKEDPNARNDRREQRGRKAMTSEAAPTARPAAREQSGRTDSAHHARRIAAPVRDRVFVRDKGQCTYTGSNGRQCASTRALQIDHIEPVARGGAGTSDNLRLLCAYHNRLEAERVMGRQGVRDGPPLR